MHFIVTFYLISKINRIIVWARAQAAFFIVQNIHLYKKIDILILESPFENINKLSTTNKNLFSCLFQRKSTNYNIDFKNLTHKIFLVNSYSINAKDELRIYKEFT